MLSQYQYEMITLWYRWQAQMNRIVWGLSPDERKNILYINKKYRYCHMQANRVLDMAGLKYDAINDRFKPMINSWSHCFWNNYSGNFLQHKAYRYDRNPFRKGK